MPLRYQRQLILRIPLRAVFLVTQAPVCSTCCRIPYWIQFQHWQTPAHVVTHPASSYGSAQHRQP
jgi:hypothetical protein